MGYHLLDHPNPHGPHFDRRRRGRTGLIVVHATAGRVEVDRDDLPDESAELTAHYAATTTRRVSWHSGSDTDSVIRLLPASYQAWHVRGHLGPGPGYSECSYGHEISLDDMDWGKKPDWWVDATLHHAGIHLGQVSHDLSIPIRHISVAQADHFLRTQDPADGGWIGHDVLDPSRRRDPGNIDWDRLLDIARTGKEEPTMFAGLLGLREGDRHARVEVLQHAIRDVHAVDGVEALPRDGVDGHWGGETSRWLGRTIRGRTPDDPVTVMSPWAAKRLAHVYTATVAASVSERMLHDALAGLDGGGGLTAAKARKIARRVVRDTTLEPS